MKKRKIQKESFMKGVFILMISQILVKILGVIYKLYLTNREGFGDKGNAIYSSGFQIYALFLTISSIGVPNAVAKLVSEKVAIKDYKAAHHISIMCNKRIFQWKRKLKSDSKCTNFRTIF